MSTGIKIALIVAASYAALVVASAVLIGLQALGAGASPTDRVADWAWAIFAGPVLPVLMVVAVVVREPQ